MMTWSNNTHPSIQLESFFPTFKSSSYLSPIGISLNIVPSLSSSCPQIWLQMFSSILSNVMGLHLTIVMIPLLPSWRDIRWKIT